MRHTACKDITIELCIIYADPWGNEGARSALECGGLTPPCSFEIHTDQRAKQGRSASQEPGMNLGRKAASSRRTPRRFARLHLQW